MRNEICTLVVCYNNGAAVERREQEIFCSRKSPARSEYYAAYAVGLKPRLILEINPLDWESMCDSGERPNKVIFRGEEMNILRDYQSDESSMELTVG